MNSRNPMKSQKYAIFVKKKKKMNMLNLKIYRRDREHCHFKGEYVGATHSICNLKYSVTKEITIAFHNAFNYDYHFIIKELA